MRTVTLDAHAAVKRRDAPSVNFSSCALLPTNLNAESQPQKKL